MLNGYMCFEFGFAVKDFAAFFALVSVLMFFVAGCWFTWNRYVWRGPLWMVRRGGHGRYAFRYIKSHLYHHKLMGGDIS